MVVGWAVGLADVAIPVAVGKAIVVDSSSYARAAGCIARAVQPDKKKEAITRNAQICFIGKTTGMLQVICQRS
jgi:hypothetical protein